MSVGSLAKFGGGVKSVQTGYTSGASLSSGSGEDTRYRDITISAVADITKCVVSFVGGGGPSDTAAAYKTDDSSASYSYLIFPRLTSTTNLRLSSAIAVTNLLGRWTVVEYQ